MSGLTKNFIGLTGGIGAGKSTVSARLAALGAVVLDADAISRSALEPDGCCFADVVDLLGSEILRPDRSIDRGRVAQLVFSDESLRQRLNAIVHPAVRAEMLRLASAVADPYTPIIFDVPLLFESGWDRMMRKNIVVVADDSIRIARICARDHCTREAAQARMRAQMPQQERQALADFVLNNNGTEEDLIVQVDALYAQMREEMA